MTPREPATDHDLLVRIDTKVDRIDVTLTDHEQRLRWQERVVWIALGVGAASGGVAGGIITSVINGVAGN